VLSFSFPHKIKGLKDGSQGSNISDISGGRQLEVMESLSKCGVYGVSIMNKITIQVGFSKNVGTSRSSMVYCCKIAQG
jgi:hypothetical protein